MYNSTQNPPNTNMSRHKTPPPIGSGRSTVQYTTDTPERHRQNKKNVVYSPSGATAGRSWEDEIVPCINSVVNLWS